MAQIGGDVVNNGHNGFYDLFQAVRKYLVPSGIGGGYTKEEATAYKQNLIQADNTDLFGGLKNDLDWIVIGIFGLIIYSLLFRK